MKFKILNLKFKIEEVVCFLWGGFIFLLYIKFLLERKGICLKLPF